MAYDEALADRVRHVIGVRPGVEEKRMFGALAFCIGGHIACGVTGEDLMVRLGPEESERALAERGVRPFEMGRGRPAKGFVLVSPEAIEEEEALAGWVDEGADFAASLPPKS